VTAPPRPDLIEATGYVTQVAAARVPPHDTDAERAVLGCLLLDPEAVHAVRDVVEPNDFYAEKHQHLYLAAVTLADRGEPIDMLTLPDQLERGGERQALRGHRRRACPASQAHPGRR